MLLSQPKVIQNGMSSLSISMGKFHVIWKDATNDVSVTKDEVMFT